MKSHIETLDCEVASDSVSLDMEDSTAMLREGDEAPLHPCSMASVPATPHHRPCAAQQKPYIF